MGRVLAQKLTTSYGDLSYYFCDGHSKVAANNFVKFTRAIQILQARRNGILVLYRLSVLYSSFYTETIQTNVKNNFFNSNEGTINMK